MTKKRPPSPEQQAERQRAKATLNARLAHEVRAYDAQWCDPAGYRRVKNVAAMREQSLTRIRRRDAMMDWLRMYESWREANKQADRLRRAGANAGG